MIPRASEVQVVVDILESDEHEDSQSMAKVIVKTLAAELAKRETFCVARGLATDDLRIGFGPYYGLAEAKRIANANRAIDLVAHVIPLNPAEEAMPREVPSLDKRCVCSHPHELHGIAMTDYLGRPKPAPSIGCTVRRCECSEYVKG